jgi:chemotaxis protein CheD
MATVVGTAVAVCLRDRRLGCGGMTHFLYPVTRDPAQATPKFGNAAIVGLIKMMKGKGSRSADIEALVFGGACPDGLDDGGVAKQNIEMARSALNRRGIRIISEDVGGYLGRKIAFNIKTGEAACFKTRKLRQSDWLIPNRK